MDMTTIDPVRDELLKTDPKFRDLVHKHDDLEKRLTELAHLTYPSEEEQQEESILKKQKLTLKDEIFTIIHDRDTGH